MKTGRLRTGGQTATRGQGRRVVTEKLEPFRGNVMLLALPNGVNAIERHQVRSKVSQLKQGLAREAARAV